MSGVLGSVQCDGVPTGVPDPRSDQSLGSSHNPRLVHFYSLPNPRSSSLWLPVAVVVVSSCCCYDCVACAVDHVGEHYDVVTRR